MTELPEFLQGVEVLNSTVYNTDDILHYVALIGDGYYQKVSKIKIRYLNKPKRRGWGREAPEYWVYVEHDYYSGDTEIAILRYTKLGVPALAQLAQVADEELACPDKVRKDLIDRLCNRFNGAHKIKAENSGRTIRVADRSNITESRKATLANLKKKLEDKRYNLQKQVHQVERWEQQIEWMRAQIPTWQTEVIPEAIKEVEALEANIAKREKKLAAEEAKAKKKKAKKK